MVNGATRKRGGISRYAKAHEGEKGWRHLGSESKITIIRLEAAVDEDAKKHGRYLKDAENRETGSRKVAVGKRGKGRGHNRRDR